MTLLALECSSPQRSVAITRDGTVLAERSLNEGRETPLFGLIEAALSAASVSRDAIDALVVGLGPGSYTGIRAALAVAQGWQLARGEPENLATGRGGVAVLGLDSLAACAWRARAQGLRGPVTFVADAQRGEFYVADYDLSQDPPRAVSPTQLATRTDLENRHRAGATWAGPDLAAAGLPGTILLPDASALAQLAHGRTDFTRADLLEPIYLRATSFVKAPPARAV